MSVEENKHIFEVLCEMRFSGLPVAPAGAVLPGILFSWLQQQGLVSTMEALPHAQIPSSIRDLDGNLKYLTTHRMKGAHGYGVAAGDHAVAVGITREYDGWPHLREKVRMVFDHAIQTQVLGQIERVSIKYLNLFEGDLGTNQLQALDTSLRVGSRTLTSEPVYLRYELKDNDFSSVIQIYGQGTLNSQAIGFQATGLVLEMDFVAMCPHRDIDAVMSSLDLVHSRAVETYRDIKGER